MKRTPLLFFLSVVLSALGLAQSNSTAAAPGSSLPGLGGVALGLNGPGFVEIGGSHSALSGGNSDWNDFYLRGMMSGGRNIFNAEVARDARFGDSGWFGGLGMTRTFSENWYAQFSAGASAGGFFLPRFRTDALINRKLLNKRQLVATLGVGFDKSKTVDHDLRTQIGGAYYFQHPVIIQGGIIWTYANPGSILARTQYLAVSQGHDKEHFISLRYGWGREGYEVVGPPVTTNSPFNVLFNFPVHDVTATWRQWIGPTWGMNLNLEQHQEPAYHRWGGTAGVFLEF